MENLLVSLLTDPFFIFLASVVIFLMVTWAVLPFAIFGVRRRLDSVIENLDKIQSILTQTGPSSRLTGITPPGVEHQNGDYHTSRQLMVDLRKELLQFAPAMQEKALDSENVVVFFRGSEGVDVPCLVLSLKEHAVQVSVPLQSLENAFSNFSSEQFRDYAVLFLPEKHGFFATPSPDGKELHVNIEPRESNPLDLFVGIIREQMYEPIRGGEG